MIIDAHAHVGPYIADPLKRKKIDAHPDDTVEAYLRDMDDADIDMGITFGRLDRDNQYQADIQKKYPDRIISCAFIDPRTDDAVKEFRHCVEDLELKGLKLHGWWHSFSCADHDLLDPLFEICAKYDLPVIMHSMGDNCYTTPVQIEEMAHTFPTVKFIAAHGGNLWLAEEGTQVSERTANVIMDASSMEGFRITHNAKTLKHGQFIMGSGWPFNNLRAVRYNIERCVPDLEAREWIMGRAAAELFHIKWR